jgi:hypothetical protein
LTIAEDAIDCGIDMPAMNGERLTKAGANLSPDRPGPELRLEVRQLARADEFVVIGACPE